MIFLGSPPLGQVDPKRITYRVGYVKIVFDLELEAESILMYVHVYFLLMKLFLLID
jgi:hypothetical protein